MADFLQYILPGAIGLPQGSSIGYKNIPVSIDDAPKAVQGERNVVTTISARSAQRIECVGGKVRWKTSSHSDGRGTSEC